MCNNWYKTYIYFLFLPIPIPIPHLSLSLLLSFYQFCNLLHWSKKTTYMNTEHSVFSWRVSFIFVAVQRKKKTSMVPLCIISQYIWWHFFFLAGLSWLDLFCFLIFLDTLLIQKVNCLIYPHFCLASQPLQCLHSNEYRSTPITCGTMRTHIERWNNMKRFDLWSIRLCCSINIESHHQRP